MSNDTIPLEKTAPKLENIFSQLSTFVDKSVNYLKGVGGEQPETKINEEDEFMPLKHLRVTENLILENPILLEYLLRLEHKIRKYKKDEKRRSELIHAYVVVLHKLI